jgi:hypothetical protein
VTDALIMLAFGLCMAGGCFFLAVVAWREGREQRSWRPVEATVVDTTLESRAGDFPAGGIGAGENVSLDTFARPTTYYFSQVRYRYVAEGKERESTHMGGLQGESNLHDLMKKKVAGLQRRFPPGAVVAAYVNPNDPNDAVLIRGHPAWVSPLFAGLGAVILLGCALYGLRQLRY